jgi:phage terminase large subunit
MDRSTVKDPIIAYRDIPYKRLESQQKFHDSESRFKGFSGPIGSGKSQALVQQAIKLCMKNPGRTGLLGAPTFQMLRDATQKPLFETLEQAGLCFSFNKSEGAVQLQESRSTILLRSLDEYEHLRGTNLAWFGVDELSYTHEAAWLRLEGRLRDRRAPHLCGFAAWTPKGFDWVYRRFIQDQSGSYEVIRAKPFENTHLLEAVPDFYERLRKTYDPLFFEQEVLGEYINQGGGKVYRNFLRSTHLRPCEIDAGKPLLWALDFNVNPMCSIIAQIDGGKALVLNEIELADATTEQACEEFSGLYKQYLRNIRIYGDASGSNSHSTGSSDYEIIQKFFKSRFGLTPVQRVPQKNPLIRDRVSLLNAKLLNMDGETNLFVDPKCKGLIADFEELSYKEGSMIPDKEKDSKRSHLSDALGYLLWQEFRSAPIESEKVRIF